MPARPTSASTGSSSRESARWYARRRIAAGPCRRPDLVIDRTPELGRGPDAVAVDTVRRRNLRIRQIAVDARLVELLDEIVRRLLQREHFDALIPHDVDDGLRVRMAFVDVEGHHAGDHVAGVRPGRCHGRIDGRRQLRGRAEERPLPPHLEADAGERHQHGDPAARDDRQYQREHGENHEPRRRGYDHGDVRQRLQVLGEHAQDAARQCESGEYDRQDAKETVASAAWGACFRDGPFLRSAGRRAGPPSRRAVGVP